MKKYRLFPLFLVLALLLPLLALPASATESGSDILDSMYVEATAALLVDADYGEILYEQDAYEMRYPASITKVMTAMLTIEAIESGALSADQIVTVSGDLQHGIGTGGSTADIRLDEEMALKDLLACALIKSANEACNALAVVVAGDVDAFVVLMNQRARELGMEDTHFANTHGYHDDDHYTTAWDIYLMCDQAMEYDLFRELVSSRSYTVPATNLSEERTLYDTNALVSSFNYAGYLYEYATGIKTGSTNEARYCLASSATKDGKNLIAVVLGAENPKNEDGTTQRLQFSESIRLLEWGFDNFSRTTILDSTLIPAEVEVTLSEEANYVTVQPSGVIEACLPKDMDMDSFTIDWSLDAETVEAPVEEGQVMGSITVTHNDTDYGTLDLVARNDVSRSETLYRIQQIQAFLDQTWVKVAIAVVLLLIVILILRLAIFGRRRSSGRRTAYSGGRRRR